MASTISSSSSSFSFLLLLLSLLLLSSLETAKARKHVHGFKMTHLHFYLHNIVTGPNPTVNLVHAGGGKNGSATGFGLTVVMNDPLTIGPKKTSKLIGKAEGIYALATPREEMGLLTTMNFVFREGKYNGSSLAIIGRNGLFEKERELPVVGGSGLFRLARGYALARAYWLSQSTGDATTEYDVYVFHQ